MEAVIKVSVVDQRVREIFTQAFPSPPGIGGGGIINHKKNFCIEGVLLLVRG